jgi:AbrB family looped-hinge helix DNA binding protein
VIAVVRSPVRRYLTQVKTVVSTKGQIVLPAELRKRDRIVPGDRLTIERVKAGTYTLTLEAPKGTLVEWLLACPEKDWFVPPDRSETTLDWLKRIERDLPGRHERAQRADAPRAGSGRRRVARRKRR